MRWVMIFSSVCVGLFILACGVMWGLGVFSGLGPNAAFAAVIRYVSGDGNGNRIDGADVLQQSKRPRCVGPPRGGRTKRVSEFLSQLGIHARCAVVANQSHVSRFSRRLVANRIPAAFNSPQPRWVFLLS